MDRVFSVDDISGQLWYSHPPIPSSHLHHPHPDEDSTPSCMNRSESEWAFQRFLLEAEAELEEEEAKDVVEIKNPCRDNGPGSLNGVAEVGNGEKPGDDCGKEDAVLIGDGKSNSGKVPVDDAEEYQAFLKSKLNLACAAVALSRASFVIQQDSSSLDCSQTTTASQPGSEALSKGHHPSRSLDKEVPPPSEIQKKTAVPVRSGMSGSSRDPSDDDESGETATTENMDPADAKRVKRYLEGCHRAGLQHKLMLSNRESARRSRRRKQAHLSELETQVAQLRVENSSLQKRLGDLSHKYNEAAVDNRVLKADVETLRAKVKMAEETVKRLTGLNPMLHVMAEISPAEVPSFNGSPLDASTDAAVPVEDDPTNQFYQFNPSNSLPSSHGMKANAGNATQQQNGALGASPSKMAQTTSMHRALSLEHLQKRIRGDLDPSASQCRSKMNEIVLSLS